MHKNKQLSYNTEKSRKTPLKKEEEIQFGEASVKHPIKLICTVSILTYRKKFLTSDCFLDIFFKLIVILGDIPT